MKVIDKRRGNRISMRRILFLATILAALISLTFLISVSPTYASLCQITNVTFSNPSNVGLGEQLMVSTTISGSCAPSDSYYYSARVDVTDSSNKVIASNSAAISYSANNGQPFTVTIPNQITAPPTIGPWEFQYVVYVFVSAEGGYGPDYETIQPETIGVGQVTVTQTNTIITTQTPNPTTEITTLTTTQTVGPTFGSEDTYPLLAAAFAILFVITLGILIKQRRAKS